MNWEEAKAFRAQHGNWPKSSYSYVGLGARLAHEEKRRRESKLEKEALRKVLCSTKPVPWPPEAVYTHLPLICCESCHDKSDIPNGSGGSNRSEFECSKCGEFFQPAGADYHNLLMRAHEQIDRLLLIIASLRRGAQ